MAEISVGTLVGTDNPDAKLYLVFKDPSAKICFTSCIKRAFVIVFLSEKETGLEAKLNVKNQIELNSAFKMLAEETLIPSDMWYRIARK